MRIGCAANIEADGIVTSGTREYGVFLAGDAPHAQLGYASITLSRYFNDASDVQPFHVYASAMASYPNATLRSNFFQSTNTDDFSFYAGQPAQLTLDGNNGNGGNGWINSIATSGVDVTFAPFIRGATQIFSIGATYGVKVTIAQGPSPLNYAFPAIETWFSAFGLRNELGYQSLIKTNAAGDLVLAPYSNKVTVPDEAYDATTWDGSLAVPTKNAVRDKIESILASGGPFIPSSYLDTDGTMAANSDTKIASQKAARTYIAAQIANLINGAPGALDTLEELADALADDANFAATMTAALASKAALSGAAFTGPVSLVASVATQMLIGSNSGKGLAMMGIGSDGYISGGATHNGAAWIATATKACIIEISGGRINFYVDTGLTAGSSFSPTIRVYIDSAGIH
jgi:hypothetical protein